MTNRTLVFLAPFVLTGFSLVSCGQDVTASGQTEERRFIPGEWQGNRFAVTLMLEGEPPIELMRGELALGWLDPETGVAAASVLSPTTDAERLAADDSVHEHADSIRSTLHILSGLILHECSNDGKAGVDLVAQPEIQDNSVALHLVRQDDRFIGDWSHDGWGVKARGSIVLAEIGYESRVRCVLPEPK